jgi:hypothetical protein
MAAKSHFPPIPPALIDDLARLFPDRCPDSSMSDREVWMAAGAASVVRKLRLELARQENNILEI